MMKNMLMTAVVICTVSPAFAMNIDDETTISTIKKSEISYVDKLDCVLDFHAQMYPFQCMGVNPSLESLKSLKHQEIGLFCEEDNLFCYNTKKILIEKSDDITQGIRSTSYDRILKTLQDIVNPTYLYAGLGQEEELNQKGAYHFYNGTFEQITIEDEKVLRQYLLIIGCTPEFEQIMSQQAKKKPVYQQEPTFQQNQPANSKSLFKKLKQGKKSFANK